MKKIIKVMALAIVCLQLTVCLGCGSSGGSSKKSSSKSKGFDTPEKAIEAYLKAAVDEDANAIYNMFYEDEIDIYLNMLKEENDVKMTKSEFKSNVKDVLEYEIEDFQEDLSYYSIKDLEINYEDRYDYTNEFLIYDEYTDSEYREFNERLRKKYDDIGLKKIYTYDSVGMINEETDHLIEFYDDDVCCIQFGDKWYISIMNVDL